MPLEEGTIYSDFVLCELQFYDFSKSGSPISVQPGANLGTTLCVDLPAEDSSKEGSPASVPEGAAAAPVSSVKKGLHNSSISHFSDKNCIYICDHKFSTH